MFGLFGNKSNNNTDEHPYKDYSVTPGANNLWDAKRGDCNIGQYPSTQEAEDACKRDKARRDR